MTFFSKFTRMGACVFSLFVASAAAAAPNDLGERKDVTIGTAGVTGVYYPAGGAICRLVNRQRGKLHNIHCGVESTGGSIYNLNAIRQGELDLGVAQSDWQYHAYLGTALFEYNGMGPDEDLRSVFSLHSEPFTIVARKDSGIQSLDDLLGKRVSIGNPGSGMRATMEILMQAKGWQMDDFKRVYELKATEQGQALCDNNIDAMIYAAGHPNGAIQEVTSTCDAQIIPVEGEAVDRLVEEFPFYAYANIPGDMYAGNPTDIPTFGVKATFVSSAKVDPELVYTVVKAVFENIDGFKALHPVFSTLDPAHMVEDGNTAPLHPGAERYFREAGLLNN